MAEIRNSVARVAAFARKEIIAIVRQPRLLAALILGPFLILALFGLGYQQRIDPLATVFVTSGDTEFAAQLQEESARFEDRISIVGTLSSRNEAIRQLRAGTADVAVIVPDDPLESIRNGERAVFTVLHDQLDPFEQATISLISRTTVDVVNRRILEELVASGQEETADLETLLPSARASATGIREAMEAGDTPTAELRRRELARQLGQIEQLTGATEVLTDNIRTDFTDGGAANATGSRLGELSDAVAAVDVTAVGDPLGEEIDEVRGIEAELDELSANLTDFRRIPPEILVSPFGAESDVVGSVDLDITAFYAPGVIALLIQHIGITLGGLSLVRERALGTPELFRVSPLHAGQIVAGKYLGYLFAIGLVAVALSLLMVGAFGVPLVGSVVSYCVVLALLAVASLGIGFSISAIVDSDTQAVNLSLIVLLLSIFFSGFFLSLDRLVDWVRGVSWALPITHAIDSLRDVMFRAEGIDLRTLWSLGVASVGLFVASLYLLQWRLRAE